MESPGSVTVGAMILFGATVTLIGFAIWALKKSSPNASVVAPEIPAEAPSEGVGAGR